MEYVFCKPMTEEDYEALYKMMDSVFGDEDVRGITSRFAEHHPEMTEENFFMVRHGEEVAAGLVLLPQRWIIDGVEIKVAEMGCVGTSPKHRRKRLQWILNDEFDSYARENGYDLCVLAGIPFFYRQFGYQYAVELDFSTEIEVTRLPDTHKALVAREEKETEIPELDAILQDTQSGYFVKSLRTPGIWKMQMETSTYGGEPYNGAVLTKEGKIGGYYRYVVDEKNSTLYIRELGYSKNTNAEEVVVHLKELAEKKGLTKIKTAVSHDDEINRYLTRMGAKQNKPYAWQVKPLDLFKLMEKMKPAFEERIADSKFNGLTKELKFNFFRFAVRMDIKDGKIVEMEKYYGEEKRTLGFNPYAFIQMIMGYKNREDLMKAYPDFWVRDGLDELIDVMFPKKPGYIHYTY